MRARLLCVALGGALVVGEIVEFPVEYADEMSVARFEVEYVATMRPVVIRGSRRTRAEAAAWTAARFAEECGGGGIFRFVRDAASTDWAGFDHDVTKKVPLGDLLGEMATAPDPAVYGFDYDLKCACPAYVRNATVLPYFKRDVFPQNEHETAVWPCLIAGPPGSKSQLHVDNSYLPFWLTLLAGRKVFRCVELGEWRSKLVPRGIVTEEGETLIPLESYDDDAALMDAFGDARVYSSTLYPGDSVYIPVGGLHGGSNVGETPALAVTANYDDAAHHPLLLEHYCEWKVARRPRGKTRLEALLRKRKCLFWAGVVGDAVPRGRGDDVDAFAPMADVVYGQGPTHGPFCRTQGPRVTPCPPAKAMCPKKPREDSKYIEDLYDDGVISRQDVALRFAEMSERYMTVPDDDVTYAHIRDWVTAEVDALWPPGVAHLSAAQVDAKIVERFFDGDGNEL